MHRSYQFVSVIVSGNVFPPCPLSVSEWGLSTVTRRWDVSVAGACMCSCATVEHSGVSCDGAIALPNPN